MKKKIGMVLAAMVFALGGTDGQCSIFGRYCSGA